MTKLAAVILLTAAALEVGGDAVIRIGLRGHRPAVALGGCVILGAYGLVVNMVTWDFSRLLGSYVAVFAVVTVVIARAVFRENIPASTWLGLALIVAGGLVIQRGSPPVSP